MAIVKTSAFTRDRQREAEVLIEDLFRGEAVLYRDDDTRAYVLIWERRPFFVRFFISTQPDSKSLKKVRFPIGPQLIKEGPKGWLTALRDHHVLHFNLNNTPAFFSFKLGTVRASALSRDQAGSSRICVYQRGKLSKTLRSIHGSVQEGFDFDGVDDSCGVKEYLERNAQRGGLK